MNASSRPNTAARAAADRVRTGPPPRSSLGGSAFSEHSGSNAGRDRAPERTPAGLTTRELEVLARVAEGLRNAQIAERLIVARKTVDRHVSAILCKLDAPTRGQAAATAIRSGLLEHDAQS